MFIINLIVRKSPPPPPPPPQPAPKVGLHAQLINKTKIKKQYSGKSTITFNAERKQK